MVTTYLAVIVAVTACSRSTPLPESTEGYPEVPVQPAEPRTYALEDWELGPDKWPTTCDAAARDALQFMGPESCAKFVGMPEGDLIMLHHGLGMGVRNRQGFWRGNIALIKSCAGGRVVHPDEASMIAVHRAWELARKEGCPQAGPSPTEGNGGGPDRSRK